ncbi:GTP-binding protein [Paenibacillus sp. SC116]|uniref:CobW family GTP-binding protein n=1 Tax=Paenibacillus sp. SC116 TaxID=2968986 RepID=UPI00215A97F1|nr:GTP-binding protein [Paenibacillus sp. SC116]MCR8842863.1 GTP-binding protein [Paenibacillus sp. SC116]
MTHNHSIMDLMTSSSERHDIPVVILAGFLGSGKTTLLQQWTQQCLQQGMKPAVIMNEAGDVNLDGQLLPEEVNMEELLGGCICCSIRGDFGMKLLELVQEHQPDVVYVECTGIAEPMELVDALTDVSLYAPVQLTHIVTLVDVLQLSHWIDDAASVSKPSRKMMHLLQEQIRAANLLIVNKCDLVQEHDIQRVEQQLKQWNKEATIVYAEQAQVKPELWQRSMALSDELRNISDQSEQTVATPQPCSCQEDNGHDVGCEAHTHHQSSHAHVTVWTRALPSAVDSHTFEQWLKGLPQHVYRAKGIVTFSDTTKRYMFQFAYRQTEFIPIRPQGDIDDVIVLIGEQMDAEQLYVELQEMLRL